LAIIYSNQTSDEFSWKADANRRQNKPLANIILWCGPRRRAGGRVGYPDPNYREIHADHYDRRDRGCDPFEAGSVRDLSLL
jgi:hypothetical protein